MSGMCCASAPGGKLEPEAEAISSRGICHDVPGAAARAAQALAEQEEAKHGIDG